MAVRVVRRGLEVSIRAWMRSRNGEAKQKPRTSGHCMRRKALARPPIGTPRLMACSVPPNSDMGSRGPNLPPWRAIGLWRRRSFPARTTVPRTWENLRRAVDLGRWLTPPRPAHSFRQPAHRDGRGDGAAGALRLADRARAVQARTRGRLRSGNRPPAGGKRAHQQRVLFPLSGQRSSAARLARAHGERRRIAGLRHGIDRSPALHGGPGIPAPFRFSRYRQTRSRQGCGRAAASAC